MNVEEAIERNEIQKLFVDYVEQRQHLEDTNTRLKNEVKRLEDAVRNIIAQRKPSTANKATTFYLEVEKLLSELEDNSRRLVEISSNRVLSQTEQDEDF